MLTYMMTSNFHNNPLKLLFLSHFNDEETSFERLNDIVKAKWWPSSEAGPKAVNLHFNFRSLQELCFQF